MVSRTSNLKSLKSEGNQVFVSNPYHVPHHPPSLHPLLLSPTGGYSSTTSNSFIARAALLSAILGYILYVLGSLPLSVFLGGVAIAGLNIFQTLAYYDGSPKLIKKPHKPQLLFQ